MNEWSALTWIVICAIPVGLILITLWTGARGARATGKPRGERPRDPF